jgi:hypothetical protein
MSEYDDTNRFTLWGNKDKTEATPTWADFQGTINIDGKEYYLSAWKRKAGANPKSPPLSGTVKVKEAQQPKDYSSSNGNDGAHTVNPNEFQDDLDSIPF